MRKYIYILLTIVLSLVHHCFVAPTTEEPNFYKIRKNQTKTRPDSLSKKEHGKWDVFFLRPFIGFIIQTIESLLKFFEERLQGAVSVLEPLVSECEGLDTNRSFFTGVLQDFKAKVQLISPGTKWCGAGNVATSYNDIGVMADSDKCCRAHDFCPEGIAAGETKYGLKNSGLFTRSLCTCDEEFYNCLKNINGSEARDLGITYFNILGPQCFELVNCSDFKVKCRNRQTHGTQYLWSNNPKF